MNVVPSTISSWSDSTGTNPSHSSKSDRIRTNRSSENGPGFTSHGIQMSPPTCSAIGSFPSTHHSSKDHYQFVRLTSPECNTSVRRQLISTNRGPLDTLRLARERPNDPHKQTKAASARLRAARARHAGCRSRQPPRRSGVRTVRRPLQLRAIVFVKLTRKFSTWRKFPDDDEKIVELEKIIRTLRKSFARWRSSSLPSNRSILTSAGSLSSIRHRHTRREDPQDHLRRGKDQPGHEWKASTWAYTTSEAFEYHVRFRSRARRLYFITSSLATNRNSRTSCVCCHTQNADIIFTVQSRAGGFECVRVQLLQSRCSCFLQRRRTILPTRHR